jgi:tetratricopeptide (TPR) repeat protein
MILVVLTVFLVVVLLLIGILLQTSKHKNKFDKAKESFQAGRYEDALKLFGELYAKDQGNRLYNWFTGQCYENMRNYELALVEYNKVALTTTFEPPLNEMEVHERIAQLNLKIGNVKNAYQEFQTVISLSPEHAEAYYYIGIMSRNKGELQKGLEYFEKAVRYKKQYPEAYFELGRVHYLLNHSDKAKRALSQAISLNPGLSEAHFYYGLALENDHVYNKSIEEFQKACKDDRFTFDACVHLASIYIALSELESPKEYFEKALEHGTTDIEALLDAKYRYANFLVQSGDLNKAMTLWNEIVSIKPHFRDVDNRLQVYGEISKSSNLTRFMTSLKGDFLSTGREICGILNFRVETFDNQKDDFIEFTGTYKTAREDQPAVLHLARWTNPVGEIPVRELLERMAEKSATRGIFITSSSFTDKAHDLSRMRPLVLIEREKLEGLLEKTYTNIE